MRLALFLLLCAATVPTCAAGYVVIVNPSLAGTKISENELKQIFLGATTRIGGKPVEPVVARSGAAHKEFASGCLGKTESGMQNYFRTLVFTGKGGMPKSFATTAEIIEYVSRTEGAIGYVSPGTDLTGVVLLEPK
jgi:ABC-type phosphate transport system substrate-binding protein